MQLTGLILLTSCAVAAVAVASLRGWIHRMDAQYKAHKTTQWRIWKWQLTQTLRS